MVRAAALTWVVEGFRLQGMDLDRAARRLGLAPPYVTEDAEREVPLAAYAGLLKAGLASDPAFAVRAGGLCPFGTFPLLDYTNAACATLRDVLHSLIRYFGLVSATSRWQLASEVLELHSTVSLPGWLKVAIHEFSLVYTARRLEEIMGRPVVRSLLVPWPAPSWSARYPPLTRFSAPVSGLALDVSALDERCPRADGPLSQLLARNAAAVLAAHPTSPSLQRSLEDLVVRLLPAGIPSMTEAARAMATSARTLRRRLRAEGLTFAQVRSHVLAALAQELLGDRRQSIEEVAYVLGFSEARAFHRAFKRWTGVTPGAFRLGQRRG
jgi:AraC-like DNA-binding protein